MIVIPASVLTPVIAAARASADAEICGLLLGAADAVVAALPAANVSPTPERAFEIAPAALFAALRAERRGGPAILGHYHSHPSGEPLPSACDAGAAAADGRLWLILGRDRGGLWRAVPDGGVHGRFDPVRWRYADGRGLHDMSALFSYGTDGDVAEGA